MTKQRNHFEYNSHMMSLSYITIKHIYTFARENVHTSLNVLLIEDESIQHVECSAPAQLSPRRAASQPLTYTNIKAYISHSQPNSNQIRSATYIHRFPINHRVKRAQELSAYTTQQNKSPKTCCAQAEIKS